MHILQMKILICHALFQTYRCLGGSQHSFILQEVWGLMTFWSCRAFVFILLNLYLARLLMTSTQ